MNIDQMFPSKFIKAEDLQGQTVTLTVMTVTMEDVADKEFKPVMRFMNRDKGMVLNKTNATLCAHIWGPDTDQWQGKQLNLSAAPVMFQGKQVMGLTVAPLMPSQQQPTGFNHPNAAPEAPQLSPAAQTLDTLEQDLQKAEDAAEATQDPAADLPF